MSLHEIENTALRAWFGPGAVLPESPAERRQALFGVRAEIMAERQLHGTNKSHDRILGQVNQAIDEGERLAQVA